VGSYKPGIWELEVCIKRLEASIFTLILENATATSFSFAVEYLTMSHETHRKHPPHLYYTPSLHLSKELSIVIVPLDSHSAMSSSSLSCTLPQAPSIDAVPPLPNMVAPLMVVLSMMFPSVVVAVLHEKGLVGTVCSKSNSRCSETRKCHFEAVPASEGARISPCLTTIQLHS